MFANRTVNPSPNRTSIKEANDHLQLLHERVFDLEKTVESQSETIKRKDELYHDTVKELTELKNAEIDDLNAAVSQLRDRICHLEQLCKDKDQQIEHLTHRCNIADEISSFTPSIEKLLSAMRKLPPSCKQSGSSTAKHSTKPRAPRANSNNSRAQNSKPNRKSSFDAAAATGHVHEMTNNTMVDGHPSSHNNSNNQSFSDLRISRSFNINSNFSMSEDEDDQLSEIL